MVSMNNGVATGNRCPGFRVTATIRGRRLKNLSLGSEGDYSREGSQRMIEEIRYI